MINTTKKHTNQAKINQDQDEKSYHLSDSRLDLKSKPNCELKTKGINTQSVSATASATISDRESSTETI